VVAKRIIEPDMKALADLYWGPDGFVARSDFLEFDYEVPPYWDAFRD
jgi:hypothetical protein